MADYFETKRKIDSTDLDLKGNISVPTVAAILQYLATARSTVYGYDRDTFLKNNNAFWVVSKIRMSFKKAVRFSDEILLKTWPLKPGMLIMPRDYEFINEKGEVALAATSEWCVLDMDTHRPRRVTSTTIDTSDDYLSNRTDAGEFSRLKETAVENDWVYDRVIRSGDIDENLHTNNCVYTRIVMDCFDVDFLLQNTVKSFEIHFINETREGDVLKLYCKKTDDAYYVEAKSDNKTVIKALIEFEKNA
ncbi:MAG: hypothetical protein E7531_04860 [Ruminococcaceae bacterium]|nr:hypothetical protein [Oscillospiraceae bacterium]